MKLRVIQAVCGSLFLFPGALGADPGHWPHDLMVQLVFDRKHSDSLKGWKVPAGNVWSIEGHRIVAKNPKGGRNSVLWTEDRYSDFVLEFDFKLDGLVNSGIMLRSGVGQVQIGWSPSVRKDMTGSLFTSRKGYVSEACLDSGDDFSAIDLLEKDAWNRMVITARGALYVVELNGFAVLRHKLAASPSRGPVGLQAGAGGSIEFKNLILHSIDYDVKNQVGEHYTLWLDETGRSARWRSAKYREMIKWGRGGGRLSEDSDEDPGE